MITSELRDRVVVASWPTEFTHDRRFIGVPCGGRIHLLEYEPTTTFPVQWTTLAHCEKCKQTAVWNG